MFKLNAKLDADSLLYPLSHFECDSHKVYMLPLTSTVKSSLMKSSISEMTSERKTFSSFSSKRFLKDAIVGISIT